jgi:hypothetical protein
MSIDETRAQPVSIIGERREPVHGMLEDMEAMAFPLSRLRMAASS